MSLPLITRWIFNIITGRTSYFSDICITSSFNQLSHFNLSHHKDVFLSIFNLTQHKDIYIFPNLICPIIRTFYLVTIFSLILKYTFIYCKLTYIVFCKLFPKLINVSISIFKLRYTLTLLLKTKVLDKKTNTHFNLQINVSCDNLPT